MGADVGGVDAHMTDAGLALDAVAYGVLDQGLDREERHRHAEHLWRNGQLHQEPVPEAGLLQRQIALDVLQFVAQRGEGAAPPERITGEIGEFQQQLSRPIRISADE